MSHPSPLPPATGFTVGLGSFCFQHPIPLWCAVGDGVATDALSH